MADNDMSIVNRNRIYEIPAGTVILNEGETNMDMYKILTDPMPFLGITPPRKSGSI